MLIAIRLAGTWLALAAFGLPQLGAQGPANPFAAVSWRVLGPLHIGGRINDIAAPTPPAHQAWGTVMYVAGTGGVFGTINAGRSWEPLFDRESVATVNRVTVAPSDPRILWAGTGDPTEFSHAMASGNGVYKSVDAGHTWTHMGLDSAYAIGRIAIDAHDPNTVYVAAMGSMARPSRARGIYKTTDGGNSWSQVLVVDEWTGAIDLALDPHDPATLYAAMWQAGGTPARFVDTGPGSGIYKSTDGGRSWRQVNRGLPANGYLGRIALAPSPVRPGVIYALVAVPDSARETDYANLYTGPVGVFRSDDGGESWQPGGPMTPQDYRFYTFGIVADPRNADRVFILTAPLRVSDDGGRTLRTIPPEFKPGEVENGGDMHAFWVDPEHTDHLVLGNDIGIYESQNGGVSWQHATNLSLGQFRAVGVDRRLPFYHVYGESQDHSGIGGPSRARAEYGIASSEWRWLPSPEGGPIVTDPSDTTIGYTLAWSGRGIVRIDLPTRQGTLIDPTGRWQTETFNANHTVPIVLSPHDPRTLYTGTTRLLRSRDRGDHWKVVSGELTRPAQDSVIVMGRHVPYFGIAPAYHTLSTVAESPVAPGTIYVGTHDGLLHLTRDGGEHWTQIGPLPGAPEGVMISRVLASRAAPGTAYAAANGGLADDYGPHVYKTTDFGRHWSRIDAGLPALAAVWAIVEHPRAPRLLFLGTDVGVFVSLNGGQRWEPLRGANLPAVQVRDLAIQPDADDLAIATYGRGLWVLDDLTPFEQLGDVIGTAVPHLFPVRGALQLHEGNEKWQALDQAPEATPNPAPVLVSYWMPTAAAGNRWSLEIVDATGDRAYLASLDSVPGLHRLAWDLRLPFGASATGSYVQMAAALPGLYRARLRRAGDSAIVAERTFRVRPDPAVRTTPNQIAAIRTARRRVRALQAKLDAVVGLAKQLSSVRDSASLPPAVGAALALSARSAYRKWSDLVVGPKRPQTPAVALSVYRDELAELTTRAPWRGMSAELDALDRELESHRRALERIRGH
jgi:photosystem II stability/assembly factor-like uncharacterized protein